MKKQLIIILIIALFMTSCTFITGKEEVREEDITIKKEENKPVAVVKGLSVLGEKFYYSTSKEFEIDGIVKKADQIFDSGIYYVSEKDFKDEYIYGTSPLTYAELYYGIVEDRETLIMTPRKENPTDDINVDGLYDAVTSATSKEGSKYKDYPLILKYSPSASSTHSMNINGIKTVDIRVDKRTYAEALILEDAGLDYAIISAAKRFTANEDMTTPVYNNNVFTLLNDGSYSKPKMVEPFEIKAIDLSQITSNTVVEYESEYGEYVIISSFDGFEKEDFNDELYFNDYLKNLYAAVIKNSDGESVGAVYYEDVWVEVKDFGQIKVAISNGDVKAGTNRFINARFNKFFDQSELQTGKYSITFLSRGYTDIKSEFEIHQKLKTDNLIEITDTLLSENTTVKLDTSKLEPDYLSTLTDAKLFKGQNELKDEDFTYNPKDASIRINSGIGKYKFMLFSSKYQSVACEFTVISPLKNNEIVLSELSLQIPEEKKVKISEYTENISSIKIRHESDIKPVEYDNTRTIIINAEGKLSLESVNDKGKKIFDKKGIYKLEIQSDGFSNFTFDVEIK